MIRLAEPKDKQAFIDLWRICFDDTTEFVDWFFENRFFPEHSACVEIDGVIVSAMQSMPLPLWIRGKSLPGAIVVGVCTHPDFRGRHLMKEMFTYYMHCMRQKGILAITYKPENIPTYFSLGHYPTTRSLWFSAPAERPDRQPFPMAGREQTIHMSPIGDLSTEDFTACWHLYQSIAPAYSGMADRSERLFSLKARDYASVGGKILLSRGLNGSGDDSLPGELTGYCFYFDTDTEIHGEEFLTTSDAALGHMIHVLCGLAKGKALKVKVPPDFGATLVQCVSRDRFCVALGDFCAISAAKSPQNVMGVTDITDFVRRLDLERFAPRDILRRLVVEIIDPIVPENAVRLDLTGEISGEPPCIAIGIGYFVQVLCGYLPLKGLIEKKEPAGDKAVPFTIFDEDKANQISLILPPCECFIVDEY